MTTETNTGQPGQAGEPGEPTDGAGGAAAAAVAVVGAVAVDEAGTGVATAEERVRSEEPTAEPRRRHTRSHVRSGGPGVSLGTTPPGLSPFWRRALVALLAVQVIIIVTAGIVVAAQFKFPSVIDEDAHYSYVQQIAQHGSLPVLGKTETSLQGLALEQGIYPRPTTINPRTDGLGGLSYEAFQPPLYYITAVPAFDITGNYKDKVYALRAYGVLLLLVSVVLAARLSRAVLRERWMIGWSIVMVFFALPGVVVRFATIGNVGLAVLLAILFATELWVAWDRHATGRYMVAGAVLGLCVLTQLEMVILGPVFALVVVAEVWHRRSFRSWRPLIVAVAIPLLLVAPWFAFNEANYHMLTAGPIAIEEQTEINNPHHVHYSISQLPNDTVNSILDPTLPAEWGNALYGHAALAYLDQLLVVLLVPAGLVLALGLGRRLWTIRSGILGLPWILSVLEMWYIRYGEQWLIFARYTYPTLPILLVLVGEATETFRARFLPVVVSAGATASLICIWAFFLFSFSGTWSIR